MDLQFLQKFFILYCLGLYKIFTLKILGCTYYYKALTVLLECSSECGTACIHVNVFKPARGRFGNLAHLHGQLHTACEYMPLPMTTNFVCICL